MTDTEKKALVKTALENISNAYAPYSDFSVSAAVVGGTGKIYTGVNVENASYPCGICAERNAIFSAVNNGERTITAVAIVGGKNGEVRDYCPPCGLCRQVMREFADPKKLVIILAKSENELKEYTLDTLLPEGFGPEML